jgi:sigma-B regulation protein RsbU (phosphoserine phosphatase)
MHCAGGRATELGPTGPIVGPFDGPWTSATFSIELGDTLAIYTDGVIEARNGDKEEFGGDRLRDLVCAASCDEAAAIAKRIIDEIGSFAPGRVHDDATIVLLCRGPRR